MIPSLPTKIINIVLYQIGWFCCVLGGAWGHPLAGATAALALCGLHLLLAKRWINEGKLMLTACLIGIIVDSAQQAAGLFTFKSDPAWPLWLPPWVFVIWAQFATLFHYALQWLQNRIALSALFGLIGGPLAYGAGMRLGAATPGAEPGLTFVCLGIVWAIVTPMLCRLSKLIDEKEGVYAWPGSRTLN